MQPLQQTGPLVALRFVLLGDPDEASLLAQELARPCLFSGVSGDHGTRAYIFVNTWKPLGQTGSI